MKKLFDFRIKRTTKETKSESSKNDKGETITVEKEVETVKSQKNPIVLYLMRPNYFMACVYLRELKRGY
jgi:hypothetical protein